MALSSAFQFEVRSTGSDTNGGGFKAGATGTDWSLQDSPQYSVTDGVTAGTTTITSATASFGTDVVGNLMYVQGGTGSVTAGWYEITARTNSTTITVDRSTGLTAGTGVTLKIGGAFASIGAPVAIAALDGQIIWVKATATYSPTGNAITPSAHPNPVALMGYGTTRGDSTRAVVDASGMTAGQHTFSIGDHNVIANFDVSNSKATAFKSSATNQSHAVNCRATGWATHGFDSFQSVIGCYAVTSSNGWGYTNCYRVVASQAKSCTGSGGFTVSGTPQGGYSFIQCIADSCTLGFSVGEGQGLHNCTSYNSTSHGFVGNNKTTFANCISYGNGGWGFSGRGTTPSQAGFFRGNAAGSNTSGAQTGGNATVDTALISLTANPFTNAGSGDFSPNNTAGGGAALRALGWPGLFPAALTTGYQDVGAVQHQDSGGGGTTIVGYCEA